MDRKAMSIEAQRRMHTLIDQFSLNPKLLRYLKEDKLYYSYRVAGWASIDSITYNPKYSKAVKDFEETTGNLVYHVVESRVLVPEEVILLTMLFVSPREENWPGETLCGERLQGSLALSIHLVAAAGSKCRLHFSEEVYVLPRSAHSPASSFIQSKPLLSISAASSGPPVLTMRPSMRTCTTSGFR